MKKLAIVTTHPIQYYAPVFKLLAERVDVRVFYTWGEKGVGEKFDPGFGKVVKWDLPLLDGYNYEFLENISPDPGSHHFKGVVNPNIIDRIQAFNPDAILVYGWSYSAHLKVLRYFKGKTPIWFRGDSNLIDQQSGWKKLLRGVFLKWVYSKIDKAFYVGSANKEYYKAFGLNDKQMVFAPHAIDNSRFETNRVDEATKLRMDHGIREEDILVLFAGKLEPKKNPELLLNAFSELALKGVHLLFVGNGELENKLKASASAKGPEISSKIHFMNFQNQQMMPIIYQSCDLFCLPSKGPGETWGLAVNEAMASGKAVLVSDKVGCSRDLVKENGAVFKSDDLAELKLKLQELCSDKENLIQKGRKSQSLIKDWSFKQQVVALESCFNEG
jgi:glycosyltransferase involved in cell wall biosynthesis